MGRLFHRRPTLDPCVQLRTAAEALYLLTARLGPMRTAEVALRIAADQAAGRPFSHLGPPLDDREALSRAQAGPAILLFKALSRRMAPEQALELTRQVAVAGATIFLKHSIGPLRPETIAAMTPSELDRFARDTAGRFFNATVRFEEISARSVRFTVTHCLFPDLCRKARAAPVAPLLCEGDAVYFGEVLGTTELLRPYTIAAGASECPFELRWKTGGHVDEKSTS